MATVRQEEAIEKVVENRGNVSKAMREVGYSEKTAKNPKNLTESKGFQELCKQYGLTDSLLLKSLVSDIKKKPGNRKAELELGFKVKGLLKEKELEDSPDRLVTINFIFNGDKHTTNPEAASSVPSIEQS